MFDPPPGDDSLSPASRSTDAATARALGDRFLAIVRPIRVINAVRWPHSSGEAFLKAGGRELPSITRDSYRPLPFDTAIKRRELLDLERETDRRLGRSDPLGRLLRRRCKQARSAVDLLASRGTPAFAANSRGLYGTTTSGDDAGVDAVFAALAATAPASPNAALRTIHAVDAAVILAANLSQSLAGAGRFRVRVCDTLVSDAAASGRSIKLRRGARFSQTDLELLEVHEGWVHIGTTLNARRQTGCTFLGHAPPATTTTQEGLAVLAELLAGVCHAQRVRRLWDRYRAVRMAEAGADFRDVFRFFLADAADDRDAYQQTVRIFRGSLPSQAGPFHKDATYAVGLVRLLRKVAANDLSLLFTGKVSLADLPLLTELIRDGLLARPAILPGPFADAANLVDRLRQLPHAPSGLPRPHLSVNRALTGIIGHVEGGTP
jgi:uncharacterized protein (TIGR02421 family)